MKYGNAPAGTAHGDKCLAQHGIFVYDFENIVEVVEGKVAVFLYILPFHFPGDQYLLPGWQHGCWY
jgi:hypothetical protein